MSLPTLGISRMAAKEKTYKSRGTSRQKIKQQLSLRDRMARKGWPLTQI